MGKRRAGGRGIRGGVSEEAAEVPAREEREERVRLLLLRSSFSLHCHSAGMKEGRKAARKLSRLRAMKKASGWGLRRGVFNADRAAE